jgi:hypothetical protein
MSKKKKRLGEIPFWEMDLESYNQLFLGADIGSGVNEPEITEADVLSKSPTPGKAANRRLPNAWSVEPVFMEKRKQIRGRIPNVPRRATTSTSSPPLNLRGTPEPIVNVREPRYITPDQSIISVRSPNYGTPNITTPSQSSSTTKTQRWRS